MHSDLPRMVFDVALFVLLWATVRVELRSLQQEVKRMTTAQEQVAADLATIRGQVAQMAANYAAAGAAALEKALADQKAAWEADDEAKWQAAHAAATDIIAQMTAGQPITPPATAANPEPTPVPLPLATADTSAPQPTPAGGATA